MNLKCDFWHLSQYCYHKRPLNTAKKVLSKVAMTNVLNMRKRGMESNTKQERGVNVFVRHLINAPMKIQPRNEQQRYPSNVTGQYIMF